MGRKKRTKCQLDQDGHGIYILKKLFKILKKFFLDIIRADGNTFIQIKTIHYKFKKPKKHFKMQFELYFPMFFIMY